MVKLEEVLDESFADDQPLSKDAEEDWDTDDSGMSPSNNKKSPLWVLRE